jgi:hypothetical protein
MTPQPCHRHHACGNHAPWWRDDWDHPLCLDCCPPGRIDVATIDELFAEFMAVVTGPDVEETPKPWVM